MTDETGEPRPETVTDAWAVGMTGIAIDPRDGSWLEVLTWAAGEGFTNHPMGDFPALVKARRGFAISDDIGASLKQLLVAYIEKDGA